jgi:hypothetical protein
MMKTNDLAIVILIFLLTAILLSVLNIIALSFSDILSYLMIAVGAILIYSETIKQNKLLIFLGAIIFLLGIYFIITNNFEVQINSSLGIPIILIFLGSGLLAVHITTSTNKYFLIGSITLLLVGLILLLINSHSEMGSFIKSLLPVINFLWPISLIIIILILLLRIK